MDADFWHRRWRKNEIGFHEEDGNHLLKTYVTSLNLSSNSRVFVPLCGKTRDIAWLLGKGYSVVGCELNEQAVQQLFDELHVVPARSEPNESNKKGLTHFHKTFENQLTLDIYQGDFFALTAHKLGNINAIFDRGALVALPAQMRCKYAQQLIAIAATSKQLLVCYEYAQGLIQGPPHSVDENELINHYSKHYSIERLYRDTIEGGFRNATNVLEAAYLLTPKR